MGEQCGELLEIRRNVNAVLEVESQEVATNEGQPRKAHIRIAICLVAIFFIFFAVAHCVMKFTMAFVCKEHIWNAFPSVIPTRGCVNNLTTLAKFSNRSL